MLELLKLPGMGPKTVSLIFEATGVATVDELAVAIDEGRLADLPRVGDKLIQKLRKGIDEYRKNTGRFHLDDAETAAERLTLYLKDFPGIESITPAGSLRRGRDTVGDLDMLVTGPACEADVVSAAVEHVATLPPIDKLLARGQNKVSFSLRNSLQVDVRLLPRASYRRGPAVLHRLQDAQRGAAPARAQTRLHAQRVRAAAHRRRHAWSPPQPKKTSTARSISTTSRPSCARTAARSKPPRSTPCPRLIDAAPTFAATCTCTPSPPTAQAPSARWPKPALRAATNTSPSPTTRRISP